MLCLCAPASGESVCQGRLGELGKPMLIQVCLTCVLLCVRATRAPLLLLVLDHNNTRPSAGNDPVDVYLLDRSPAGAL